MHHMFDSVFSVNQLKTLSAIVHVSEAVYRDFIVSNELLLTHQYLRCECGRIRTKLFQMQSEIESHNPGFPFQFGEINFAYKHTIPELRTDKVILHLARSTSPNRLSNRARYKVDLSENNQAICRQLSFNFDNIGHYEECPLYALLVIGGYDTPFSVIQFPEPGYKDIAKIIPVPQYISSFSAESGVEIERKKAVLRKEFLTSSTEGNI